MGDEATRPVGRPTDYREDYVAQVYKLCLLGATDPQIAAFFEVTKPTIQLWRKVHPDFADACRRGKSMADAEVAVSLFKRANGYEHPAVKIFLPTGVTTPIKVDYIERYAPDTAACKMWLSSRQGGIWRERQELTGKDGGAIVSEVVYRWDDGTKPAAPAEEAESE